MTAFVQDEIALFGNRLAVTLGSQVQHDSYSGAGVQPTARVMWKGLPRQRLWAAASRALRTPSLYERGIRVDFPPVPSASGLPLVVAVLGNPAAETENSRRRGSGIPARDRERPRRLTSPDSSAATSTCGRRNWRPPVVQFVPSPHILVTAQFGNQLQATTRGLEVAAHWAPDRRPGGSMAATRPSIVTPQLAAASHDPAAAATTGTRRGAQWQVRTDVLPGRSRDDRRRDLPCRSARPGRRGRLHARRRHRGMAAHQTSVRHGDRPEPLRRGARRVQRRHLAAARDAGSAQRQPAAAMDLSDDGPPGVSMDGPASRASPWPRRSSRRPGAAGAGATWRRTSP